MGCARSTPAVILRPRGDSKSSATKSSHDYPDDTVLVDLLQKSAFFTGISREDINKIAQKGLIIHDGSGQLQIVPGQQFLLGGVALSHYESGNFVAKRRDIYGEECFVSNPSLLFSSKVPKSRRDSLGSIGRRESRSSERRESLAKDRQSSHQDSPSSTKSTLAPEKSSSRDELFAQETVLKLTKLERRTIAVFSKKDLNALIEASGSFKDFEQTLASRARCRSAAALQRNGCLSVFPFTELRSFAHALDFCTLDWIESQPANSTCFYLICDGVLELQVDLPFRHGDDGNESQEILSAGRLAAGDFVNETTGLLQVPKRFANRIRYRVVEKGAALCLSSAYLQNLNQQVFSEQLKQMLATEMKLRQPKPLKKLFPIFQYLSDEYCELLMEACASTTLQTGDDVARPQDFHLVRSGSIMTTGAIRRKSLGGALILMAADDPNAVFNTVVREGEFFSPECIINIFNRNKQSNPSNVGGTTTPFSLDSVPNSPETGRSRLMPPIQQDVINSALGARISKEDSKERISTSGDVRPLTTSNNGSMPPTPSSSVTSPVRPQTNAPKAMNPDTVIWTFPSDLVSIILTANPLWEADFEIRALREHVSIEAVLRHPVAAYHFRKHLIAFHADENLDFYLAARSFAASFQAISSSAASSSSSIVGAVGSPNAGTLTRSISGRLRSKDSLGGGSGPPPMVSSNSSPTILQSGPSSGNARVGASSGGIDPDDTSAQESFAMALFNEFIDEGSPRQINIASAIRNDIKEIVTNVSVAPATTFVQAQQECLKILSTDSFPRFRQSKLFEDMIRDICSGLTIKEVIAVNDSINTRKLSSGSTPLSASKKSSSGQPGLTSPIAAAKRKLSKSSPSKSRATLEAGEESAPGKLSWDMLEWNNSHRRERSGSFDFTANLGQLPISPSNKPPTSRMEQLTNVPSREDSKDSSDSSFSPSKVGRRIDDLAADPSKQRRDSPSSLHSPPEVRKRKEHSLDTISESEKDAPASTFLKSQSVSWLTKARRSMSGEEESNRIRRNASSTEIGEVKIVSPNTPKKFMLGSNEVSPPATPPPQKGNDHEDSK